MYYRVAIQVEASPSWQWKSTALNSFNLLLQWLQFYRVFPSEHLRIFSSPSREELNEQLARENQGFLSTSVPARRFLQERGIAPREVRGQAAGGSRANARTYPVAAVAGLSEVESSTNPLDKRRERLERGAGGDHDAPYQFALPISMPQVLAWLTLQVRVQQGDLQEEVVLGRSDSSANFCSQVEPI